MCGTHNHGKGGKGHGEGHSMWLMVLACAIPLLIIFLLPVFGISANYTWVAIILMFALHLFMMGGHGGHEGHESAKKQPSTTAQKEGQGGNHDHH